MPYVKSQMKNPRYQLSVTIWKAIFSFLRHLGVVSAADVAVLTPPETLAELQAHWPVLVIAAIPALWRIIENVRKNYRDSGKPLWTWPWSKLTTAAMLCILLTGCATTSVMFRDVDGAEVQLRNTVVAGKQDASIINATYEWDLNGAGQWTVGGATDTTEVEAAVEDIRKMIEALTAMFIKLGLIL